MNESIDFRQIVKLLWEHIFLIISFVIIAIGIAAILSFFILKPTYEAQTQLLINQKSNAQDIYNWDNTEIDLQLINTYNVIIKSPAILTKVIDELDLKISEEQLSEKITLTNESESKVINIKIEDQNPQQAVKVVNKIAEVFKQEIPPLMNVDNINILSTASLGEDPQPVKPNKMLNMAIASIIGLMIGVGVAFLLEYFDRTVKSEDDIEEIISLPTIGVVSLIPDGKVSHNSNQEERGD